MIYTTYRLVILTMQPVFVPLPCNKVQCCVCPNVNPMNMAQVPYHHATAGHTRALAMDHTQKKIMRTMATAAGTLAPIDTQPIASSSEAVLSQEDSPAGMDIDEPGVLLPTPSPHLPQPPTLSSSAFSHASDHFTLHAGASPLTATQSIICAAMKKMEQTHNTAADDLNLGAVDDEELPGGEPSDDNLADLEQLLENMGSAQDESYHPWPSRNVCLIPNLLVTY